jgi:NAD(P)-dependent dehydrogenase (short-subunit alcohol dehydrogenase family)
MTAKSAEAASATGRLANKVAVVTGGNKGIGRQACIELAREGADVAAIAGHDLDGAKATARLVEEAGRRSMAWQADVTNADAVEQMMEEVVRSLGRVDILVNNAGGGGIGKPLHELSEAEWDLPFALNAKGTFLCSAAAARRMIPQRSGVIINIAGSSAHRTYPCYGGFGISKAAVVAFTHQACLEWAPYGIRVVGVSPGPIRDPDDNWQEREPAVAEEVERLPLKRAGPRVEVARAITYLATEDAGYITGHMLIVDGGAVHTWYLDSAVRAGVPAPRWDKG